MTRRGTWSSAMALPLESVTTARWLPFDGAVGAPSRGRPCAPSLVAWRPTRPGSRSGARQARCLVHCRSTRTVVDSSARVTAENLEARTPAMLTVRPRVRGSAWPCSACARRLCRQPPSPRQGRQTRASQAPPKRTAGGSSRRSGRRSPRKRGPDQSMPPTPHTDTSKADTHLRDKEGRVRELLRLLVELIVDCDRRDRRLERGGDARRRRRHRMLRRGKERPVNVCLEGTHARDDRHQVNATADREPDRARMKVGDVRSSSGTPSARAPTDGSPGCLGGTDPNEDCSCGRRKRRRSVRSGTFEPRPTR